jgi:hypothetical protein
MKLNPEEFGKRMAESVKAHVKRELAPLIEKNRQLAQNVARLSLRLEEVEAHQKKQKGKRR